MSLVDTPLSPQDRPLLARSRSHTDPSRAGASTVESEKLGSKAPPARPSHTRSRSYLTPAESKSETKPRNAHTLPSATSALEKTASRLHLPGSSHRHHKEKEHNSSHHKHSQSHAGISQHNNDSTHSLPFRRHRPTQSEAHPPRRAASKENLTNLPHLVAGLNAERDRRGQQGIAYNPLNPTNRYANGQGQGQNSFGPSAAYPNDYHPGGRYDANNPNGFPELRRRATSDPASRDNGSHGIQPPLRPKTSLEAALDRGDAARVARRIHVKVPDLLRRDQELQEGEEELRARIAEITATGVEITRRLDYGYYNLLEKVGNLVSIIGSFQSLAKQSETLIANFDREDGRISEDTQRRIGIFAAGFEKRQTKAQKLAERGERASAKATDLSARLEAARTKVHEWEKREENLRKTWDRVWGICWWTVLAMTILVVSILIGKEWYFRGDPVKAGLQQHAEGNWNHSLRLGGEGESREACPRSRGGGGPQGRETAQCARGCEGDTGWYRGPESPKETSLSRNTAANARALPRG